MLCGRYVATTGATMNSAANADMPAAVFLSSAPRATPMTAAAVRYSDAPATVRSTPGSVSAIAVPPRADWIAVATKKSATAASMVTGSTRAANTASFAHSTGSLDGTTASEARIIPVPYSLLNTSTPSTPITSWAIRMPNRLTDTAVTAGCAAETRYGFPAANPAPIPTIAKTVTSALYQVERSPRSFVHSERTTRAWVTGRATVTGAAGGGASTALIASLRRGIQRCRGLPA